MNRNQDFAKAEEIEKVLFKFHKKLKKGIVWPISRHDKQGNLLFEVDHGLKNGLSGIAFFYLELFRKTEKEKYLIQFDRVIKGIEEVLIKQPDRHFGFWEGVSGVVYVVLLAHELTKQRKYLLATLDLMKGCKEFLGSRHANNSLYEGRAGVLIVLIKLYSINKDRQTLECIELALEKLLQQANMTKDGISWYFNETQSKDPLDWASGSLGISYAFAVASRFFDSPGLDLVSEQALSHCLSGWNRQAQNWPDYLNDVETPGDDKRLVAKFQKDSELISNGKFSLDIERGLIGILIGLNVARSPLKSVRINRLLKKSCSSLILSSKTSHTDRHAFHSLPGYLSVRPVNRSSNKEFISGRLGLFDGMAGAGISALIAQADCREYWSLAFGIPNGFISKNTSTFGKLSVSPAVEKIISNKFIGTFALLRREHGQKLKINWTDFNLNKITRSLKQLVDDSQDPIIPDLFKYEYRKFMIRIGPKNCPAHIYCKKYLNFLENRKMQRLSNDAILSLEFKLSPWVYIFQTKWNYVAGKQEMTFIKGTYNALVAITDQKDGLFETSLEDFDEILAYMKKPTRGIDLANAVIDQYGLSETREHIKAKLADMLLAKVQENVLDVVW